MANLTADGIRADLSAAREHLAGQGFSLSLTGIVGFCMGGSITFVAASEDAYGAAVTFYGSGIRAGRFGFRSLAEVAPLLRSPWLGLYGDLDRGHPGGAGRRAAQCRRDRACATALVRYAEAGHGFHSDARPAAYHEASAKDAWARNPRLVRALPIPGVSQRRSTSAQAEDFDQRACRGTALLHSNMQSRRHVKIVP